ncbi:uncharacterized protein A4U43_C08F31310 [Asparagus officinalis]|nr:uncharacterized protein A4U43_C08F31310 [Asparagus officinalis]
MDIFKVFLSCFLISQSSMQIQTSVLQEGPVAQNEFCRNTSLYLKEAKEFMDFTRKLGISCKQVGRSAEAHIQNQNHYLYDKKLVFNAQDNYLQQKCPQMGN